jgi:hypothetical protein
MSVDHLKFFKQYAEQLEKEIAAGDAKRERKRKSS